VLHHDGRDIGKIDGRLTFLADDGKKRSKHASLLCN